MDGEHGWWAWMVSMDGEHEPLVRALSLFFPLCSKQGISTSFQEKNSASTRHSLGSIEKGN